jgi:predicted alpha-1,6-mannanase (GH76 family)
MNLIPSLILALALFNNNHPGPKPNMWAKAADSAQLALNTQFWSATEQYYKQNNDGHTGYNYWWNAHALDVLVDGYIRTKDPAYTNRMNALLDGMYKKNGNTWTNKYFDDMEWMALACIRAYDATRDRKYKELAQRLWDHIKTGWTTDHGGGIMWQTGTPSAKNACSNGPAMIIAARLYKLNKKDEDLNWAKRIFQWQQAYLVDTSRGIVWDGFGNYKETGIYTYNMGTWVGGTLELYTITNDETYLQNAIKTAGYIINDRQRFSPDGILKGEGNGDGGLFKGIFIRYLVQLIRQGKLDRSTKTTYLQYLKANGERLLNNATYRPDFVFSTNWSTPPESPKMDCSIHLSATMLLEALAMVNK